MNNGEGSLVGWGNVIRIGGFLVQPPLDAWPGSGTQPYYEAPRDLQVEIEKNTVINMGLVRLSPWEWPKVDRGIAK